MGFEREIEVARATARKAGELALRHFAKGLVTEVKADGSPVTVADRESERLIARTIEGAFPEDGLLGEEGLSNGSRSGRRWIIDPIDGTREFVRGNSLWAILIGLEVDGKIAAGVAHFPALGETYSASQGGGAYRNDDAICVSAISSPGRSVLCISGLDSLSRQPFPAGLIDWMAQFWAVRNFGGIFDAMLVASGRAEAWVEPRVKEWDMAAPSVILEEAGARFFNFNGENSIYGGNCIACVPGIEPELRRFLVRGGPRAAPQPADG